MPPRSARPTDFAKTLFVASRYPDGMTRHMARPRHAQAEVLRRGAEELNFGRAAQRLHIAQPVLSRQIRSFEDELGVRLFARDSRGTELTDAGAQLLEDARFMLSESKALRARLFQAATPTVTVTVGVMPGLLATAAVRAFEATDPHAAPPWCRWAGPTRSRWSGAARPTWCTPANRSIITGWAPQRCWRSRGMPCCPAATRSQRARPSGSPIWRTGVCCRTRARCRSGTRSPARSYAAHPRQDRVDGRREAGTRGRTGGIRHPAPLDDGVLSQTRRCGDSDRGHRSRSGHADLGRGGGEPRPRRLRRGGAWRAATRPSDSLPHLR